MFGLIVILAIALGGRRRPLTAIDYNLLEERLWKAMVGDVMLRGFRFAVIDEARKPVPGIRLQIEYTTLDPSRPGRYLTKVATPVTDGQGVAIAPENTFSSMSVCLDRDALAEAGLLSDGIPNTMVNVYGVSANGQNGDTQIPADRRPAGFDYEFRVVRSRGPQVLWVWQTGVQMPADGTPVRMRPFSIGQPATVATSAVVPREELVVALWRDPAVPMTEMRAPFQDMPESKIPVNLDAAWSCTVSCPLGGVQVRRPWSPSESAPVDGYVRELHWSGDAKTPAFQGPLGDQPLQLWWQRPGTPVRYLQVDLRFTWEVPDRTNAPFSAATFSVVQLYRLNVVGGQVFEYRHRADVSIDLEEMPWYRRYDSVEALQAIGRESVASASSATPAAAAASAARP